MVLVQNVQRWKVGKEAEWKARWWRPEVDVEVYVAHDVTASKPQEWQAESAEVSSPRSDSTGPVITSALFSLNVTVYQLTVTHKYSSFSPGDKGGDGARKNHI